MSSFPPASSKDLEAWIDQYGPRLLPVARAFAAGPDEAGDILQEVWIIAARRSHLRPAGIPIRPWLYKVALNVGRSLARRRTRRERLIGMWQSSRDVPNARGELLSVNNELARIRLWRAVAELPELQRSVVVLRIVEDKSIRETAKALDCAEGTVQASLHRATARLRRELGGDALDESDDDRKAG